MSKNLKSNLLNNTMYLFLLTFSSQAIAIFTIPFQTRMLSVEMFGVIAFANALMVIFGLILAFGFSYSSTKVVAENNNNKVVLSQVYSSVCVIKILIAVLCFGLLWTFLKSNILYSSYEELFYLFYFSTIFGGLLPDFLYRGLEQMKVITFRTIFVRSLSAVLIFVFLRNDETAYVLPLSLMLGNVFSLAYCVYYDRTKLGIKLSPVAMSYIISTLEESFPFFISRAASTFYQSFNIFLLGLIYPYSVFIGWFNAADKVLSVAKSLSAPVADSLYPYMIKNKNFRLAKCVFVFSILPIFVICMFLFIYADQVCGFVFGAEYEQAGGVLKCFLPAIAVIFPTYVICFPVLVPMGLSKYANMSNIVGMFVQIFQLGVLFVWGSFNVYTLALSASISEVSVFLFRFMIMVKFSYRMK